MKDKFKDRLPITCNEIYLDRVESKQLIEFSKSSKTREQFQSIITCRPIKERSNEETIQLIKALLENDNNFLLGIYEL